MDDSDRRKSEMRLAAAAPELLARAHDAAKTIAWFIDTYGDSGAGLILRDLRAAIAKAEGR